MSDQPTLFDAPVQRATGIPSRQRPLRKPMQDRPAPAHEDAIDTERNAAELVRPKAGTLRMTALLAFHAAGERGLTDQELAEVTQAYLYTMAPRRVELVRDLWVEDSGDRRMSVHGRPAAVWRLTQRGRDGLPDLIREAG